MCPILCRGLSLPDPPREEADFRDIEPSSIPDIPKGTPRFSMSVYIQSQDRRFFIDLPQDEPYLSRALAVELEDIFTLYGTLGLEALKEAAENLDTQSGSLPFQERTLAAYDKLRKALDDQIKQACDTLQKHAVEMAQIKLQSGIEEVLNEGVRYLSGMRKSNDVAALFRKNPNVWGLRDTSDGGKAEAMMRALIDLRALRNTADKNRKNAQASFGNLLEKYDPEAQAATLSQGAMDFFYLKHPAMAEQAKAADDADLRLMEALTRYCLLYPLVNRLYPTDSVPHYPAGTHYLLQDPPGKPGTYGPFNDEVYHTLRDTWSAASDLLSSIQDSPDSVWEYRPIIEEALAANGENDLSIAARAAEEKISAKGVKEWIDTAAMVAGGAELLALVTTPAPPVAATIAVVSAILVAISLALEGYQKYINSVAAKAALDPTKSLAAEPSWGFFLLMAALQVVALRGLPFKNLPGKSVIKAVVR